MKIKLQLVKKQQSLIFSKRVGVWYFMCGTGTLLLPVLGHNYGAAMLCFTVSWSQNKLV